MHKNTKAKVKGAWNIIASFSSHSLWTNTEIKKEDFTMGCNRIQWILNTAQQQSSYVISKWALTALPFPKDVGSFGANNCETLLILVMHKSHLPISIRNGSNSLRKKSNTAFNTFRYCLMDSLFDSWAQSTATEQKKNVVFLRISFCLWGSIFLEHTTQQPTLSICKGKKDAKQVKKSKNFLSYLTDVLRWQKVAIYHNM